MIAGWVGLVSKAEGLRKALKDWMKGDDTYRVNSSNDELFKDMKDRVADTIDFTITGHTHLARALRFPRGGYYYNCGTWIRLLQLTPEVLESPEVFERDLWPVLNARRMDVLDTVEIPGKNGKLEPLLFDRTNAVRISAQGTTTFGDLLRVGGQTRAAVTLDIEPDTTTFKVG